MNQFVVSARKYRPATFDTVVGQAHITNTLKNAIRNKHLAQAFLFCGPRGVGKTTCARILAKTLNCRNVSENIEACNECDSCKSFNAGQSLNIYELDAASNNSVDDIRSLVEQVRYAPHAGEFKIYIIDEVHMLSSGAFNAFLKTLEEPPPYAIFILATTEKHKIIPTILSRCQIFDFNRIQVEDIAKHLEYVAASETVIADPDALHIIAQKADGALRDALSIFDQIVSFAGNSISYKDVINNLSILDYDYYFRVTDQIVAGDIAAVLLTFNELLGDGFDGHHFINGLASHFRDLLVCQDAATIELLEVSKNIRAKYGEQASQTPPQLLLMLLEICSKCDIEYRSSRNHRLHVELALIKMCTTAKGGLQTLGSQPMVEKKNPDLNKTAAPVAQSPAPAPTPVQKTVVKEAPQEEKTTEVPVSSGGMMPNLKALADTPPPPTKAAVEKTPSAPVPSSGFLKGTSLTSLRKEDKKEEKIVAINENLPADEVTTDTLQKVWIEYALMKQKEGKRQLHTTLTMDLPTMLDATNVELIIHNQSQENLLQEEKPDLMDFLRTRLNNFHLQLKTRIEERINSDEVAYTNKERYLKMVEKNPELEEFRKQLGLELE